MSKQLFLLPIIALTMTAALASDYRIIAPPEPHRWQTPIYSPDGQSIAFAAADGRTIWAIDLANESEPSQIAEGDSIGRRFVFEPDNPADRVVYRVRIVAHPDKPVRLTSTSIHIFDPGPRSSNMGEILGPYAFDGQLWYRHSLDGPFINSQGREHLAGPYLDADSRVLILKDTAGESLYTSPSSESVIGFEVSPDGNWTAAVALSPTPVLFVLDHETGERRDLGAGYWPAWSGDSRRISCLVKIRERTHIRVHDLTLDSPFHLKLETTDSPEAPALNPDGSKVVFISSGAVCETDVR